MKKLKNTLSCLVLVLVGPFQHQRLIFYQLAAMGTQEDVGGTPTGGERVWGSVGDGRARAIFSMSLAAMTVKNAVVDGWTG
jgi:hypothetical protein